MTPAVEPGPFVSVVLCAHNPREGHFKATLDGLAAQDLPRSEWELLVVDNNSSPPLAGRIDLGWHPNARILVEPQPGLARARRCAYLAARGQLIVHSDDDNVLATDFLTAARRIYREHPRIGTFAGRQETRFDVEPRNDRERGRGSPRTVESDRWSNLLDDGRTMPFGAGMCLRREVVTAYLAEVERDPRRLLLGRTGNRFITGEDIDLNFVAVRAGFGTGLFTSLSLVHLIPAERMSDAHDINYAAGNAYSMMLLHFLHFGRIQPAPPSALGTLRIYLRAWLRMGPYRRRFELAVLRARRNALADMRSWGWLEEAR